MPVEAQVNMGCHDSINYDKVIVPANKNTHTQRPDGLELEDCDGGKSSAYGIPFPGRWAADALDRINTKGENLQNLSIER